MDKGTLFWCIYIVAFLFLGFGFYRTAPEGRIGSGWGFVLWVLLGLLGWAVFGAAVK